MTDGESQAFASSLNDGLTKREHFAAMAMQGILANSSDSNTVWDYQIIGRHSVMAADALIKALNEQP